MRIPSTPDAGSQKAEAVDRADWKAAMRIVNMVRLLPLGADPSESSLGDPG